MGIRIGNINIKKPIATVNGPDMLQQYVEANEGCYSLFRDFTGANLDFIKDLDTSKVTSMAYMFYGCKNLAVIPQIDTSKVTNMNSMFDSCEKIVTIPLLDTSNVTSMNHAFHNCYKLETVPQLNTNKLRDMYYMFCNCYKLTSIPQLDTSNVKFMSGMFRQCRQLTIIPQLDASNVESITGIFYDCPLLTTLGGFKDLGKSYSIKTTANSSSYTLDLSPLNNITHDSLMNVINNLYDIATKGCQPQKLVLGETNLAKLTEEEILIATNKGWGVS